MDNDDETKLAILIEEVRQTLVLYNVTSNNVLPHELHGVLHDYNMKSDILFLKNKWVRNADGGGMSSDQIALNFIVKMILNGFDTPSIIEKIRHQFLRNSEHIWSVTEIRGVSINNIFEIEDGIYLYPNSSIPDSDVKTRVFSDNSMFPYVFPSLNGAIVQIFEFENILVERDQNELDKGFVEITTKNREVRQEKSSMIARAISLTIEEHLQLGCSFLTSEEPNIFVYSGTSSPLTNTTLSFATAEIDPDHVKDLYLKLNIFKKKELLNLAIDRLMSATQYKNTVDKMIDIGLSLEILLFNDTSGGNSEINYKISNRAAFLLGNDPSSRREYNKIAKDIYSARSEAVHKGKLSEKFNNKVFIDSALQFLREIIFYLLNKGNFPNWDDVIFGHIE